MASSLSNLARYFARRFFRQDRFVPGRFRRRHRRYLRVRKYRYAPKGRWWSDDRRWFWGGCPPRARNQLTPLIDGQAAFEAMLKAINEAEHYVYITGWALTPAFALDRPEMLPSADGLLIDVLKRVSERVPVKILVWAGAVALFQPTKRMTAEAREVLLQMAPAIDCRLDHTARPTHSHHQKAVVVDGRIGFVGGLDLTTLEGDRWDVPGHPLRFGRGWHDVALAIRGEAAADLEANFAQRWAAVTGERDLPRRDPEFDPAWHAPCQIIRTIPRRTYPFARGGEFGIAHAYQTAIVRARKFIYLENQYLWSPEIVEALIKAMRRNDHGDFRIVLVLPAEADFGKYDNDKQVERLREADAGRGIFHAYSLYSGGAAAGPLGFSYRPVYVHGKVAIIDDEWYTVGSANLNGRGLATDTEMNAQAIDPEGARNLRLRLWAEHLGSTVDDLAGRDPVELIDGLWVECAAKVEEIIDRKWGVLPALVRPYQVGRVPGAWLLRELQGLLEGL